MTDSALHQFDLELCRYIRGNLLAQSGGERYIAALRSELGDELLHCVGLDENADEDDCAQCLLTGEEIEDLEAVASDLSDRFRLLWEPYEALHRRRIRSVREIREQLTAVDAEDWAQQSAAFAKQLEDPEIGLAEGIRVAGEWIIAVQRLLAAMGKTDLLPSPASRSSASPAPSAEPLSAAGDLSENAETASPHDSRPNMERDAGVPEVCEGNQSAASLPEELTVREAAEFLRCDRKTVTALIRDGSLEWRNAAPPSSSRMRYRLRTESVVALKTSYRRGERVASASRGRRRRRKPRSQYVPQHITPPPS